mmetsp:Transcript_17130/g.37757  ORF Transcript_17130/g.37757 Transcript_17130/m.37757 type:complete len:379 (-) Transcript_17130:470-1606(-)
MCLDLCLLPPSQETTRPKRLHSVHGVQSDHTHCTTSWGHSCSLQEDTAIAAPPVQGCPPLEGSNTIVRCFLCCPPPHCSVHADQALQGPQVQSVGLSPGQGSSLQLLTLWRAPEQGIPLPLLGTATRRVECCSPPPQVAEHGVHCSQLDSTQSTLPIVQASASRLQGSTSIVLPAQGKPPRLAYSPTRLDRALCPLQSSEQLDHWPHWVKEQSIASDSQGTFVLQVRYCSKAPEHPSPPFCATSSMDRTRTALPPPQEALHKLHSPQSAHSQSRYPSTHGLVPHAATARAACASHKCPPPDGETLISLLRCFCPPPHVALHPDHGFHAPHTQSLLDWPGQDCVLQVSVPCKSPVQGRPPFSASATISRERYRCPPEQD